jgi:hypothetical protein
LIRARWLRWSRRGGDRVARRPDHDGATGLVSMVGVHLALLNGAEQKISTLVDWGWTILTKEHGKRMILSDGDVAPGPSQS